MNATVLEIRNLVIDFKTPQGLVRGVDGVNLTVASGEFLGVVGESGSGKSVTALSIAGLLDRRSASIRGSIDLAGTRLLELHDRDLRKVRGGRVGMVFQDPLGSLNPAYTIGWQVAEAITLHRPKLSRKQVRAEVVELLESMGIAEPHRAFARYPHEYSGGMRQRVMIACAIANSPELVIADEPTTALDVTIQAHVLDLLRRIRRERGVAVMLISHDLGVVGEVADRIVVMYGGRIVETGPADEVLRSPHHPYTIALLRSVPGRRTGRRLRGIPGRPDVRVVGAFAPGCPFQPRCELHEALDRPSICVEVVPPLQGARLRDAACHFVESTMLVTDAPSSVTVRGADALDVQGRQRPVLEVEKLVKDFARGRRLLRRSIETSRAVDDVTFHVAGGETLALVGESGSGKTTTARMVAGLVQPTAGQVKLEGKPVAPVVTARVADHRRAVQMVFQDPFASVNPRLRVGQIVAEPLLTAGSRGGPVRRRVEELLELVGLPVTRIRQFPHELSGGERQRVCIARALALEPKIVILDEPVSSLDVSIQAQVLNLLRDVQETLDLAFLFISHDLAVVRYLADRVAVMQNGKIVELARTEKLFEAPQHPYTISLLEAIPNPDRRRPEMSSLSSGAGS